MEYKQTTAVKVYTDAETKAQIQAEASRAGVSESKLLRIAFAYLVRSEDYKRLFTADNEG